MPSPNDAPRSRPWGGLVLAIVVVISATVAYLSVAARRPIGGPAVCAADGALLRSMSQELFVDGYVQKVDARTTDLSRKLDARLYELSRASGGRLTYTISDPADSIARGRAIASGLPEIGYEGQKIVSGLVLRYGGEKDVVPWLDPYESEPLQLVIERRLRDVVRRASDKPIRVGVLSGHGGFSPFEPNMASSAYSATSIAQLLTGNYRFYELVPVDARAGAIDPSLAGLLITQPGTDVSDEELARVDDFVLSGKPLVVFASAVNVEKGDPSMHATLGAHGIEKLTAGYGVAIFPDAVVDPSESYEIEGPPGKQPIPMPSILLLVGGTSADRSSLDRKLLPFEPLGGVLAPFASSIELRTDVQRRAKGRVVARTSRAAGRLKGDVVELGPMRSWDDVAASGPIDVGAVVEGPLRSAFGTREADRPSKVLVLASAELLANPFVAAGDARRREADDYTTASVGASLVLLKATLDWMTYDAGTLACMDQAMATAKP